MIKKILNNTIGAAIGSVGISEANKIDPFGDVIGTAMSGGILASQIDNKKRKNRGLII